MKDSPRLVREQVKRDDLWHSWGLQQLYNLFYLQESCIVRGTKQQRTSKREGTKREQKKDSGCPWTDEGSVNFDLRPVLYSSSQSFEKCGSQRIILWCNNQTPCRSRYPTNNPFKNKVDCFQCWSQLLEYPILQMTHDKTKIANVEK